jgi:Rps23 Pro-64 3,4-dihydroxylase Tpa1-like proline 4-hydroxylase
MVAPAVRILERLRGVARGTTAPHHRIVDLLPASTAEQVLAQVLDQKHNFTPLTGDRKFLRLPCPLDLLPAFHGRLWQFLPEIQARFGIDLERPEIELYVHAYNDGTRFARHSDAHGGGNWRRRISCVYYLHRRPRGFEGGALIVYDGRGRAHSLEPVHNSAIFFPSHLIHEVLPVTCQSGDFEDSRFAINVWIM